VLLPPLYTNKGLRHEYGFYGVGNSVLEALRNVYTDVNICSDVVFLQRAQCSHCKRCISYGNSVRPSVRPSVCLSVCHTPVLYQNDGT